MFGGGMFTTGILVSVIDRFTGPMNRMLSQTARTEQRMDKASARLNQLAGGARKVGFGLTAMGGAGAFAINSIMQPTMEVEDNLASLSTVITPVMGSMERDLAAVKKAARDWSDQHVQSAADFIGTSYDMVGAGLDTRQAIAGTETAMRVATATMGDHRKAAQLLAVVYNNMGDRSADVRQEMGRLGDQVTRTQQYFQFENLAQLQEGLKMAFGGAKLAGLGFSELLVAVGQLNNAGLQGSQAGTALSAALRQLDKAAKDLGFNVVRSADGSLDLIGTLENLRTKVGDFNQMGPKTRAAMQQAFGDEGLRAIGALLDKTNAMSGALYAVRNATGAAEDAQSKMEATASGRWRTLMNQVRNLVTDLGEKLIPHIKSAVQWVMDLVDRIKSFTETHPGVMETVAKVLLIGTAAGLVLGPIVLLGSGFVMVFWKMLRWTWAVLSGVRKFVTFLKADAAAGMAEFGRVGTGTATRLTLAFAKLVIVLWAAYEAARVLGTLGRKGLGQLEAGVNEEQARRWIQQAQKTLASPHATQAQREAAERLMTKAGWTLARAQDVRRESTHGTGYGGSSVPEWLGGGHTPETAPRKMILMGAGGEVQVQGLTPAAPEGLPPLGAGGEPFPKSESSTGGRAPMEVQDPELRRLMERMNGALERLANRPVTQHISVEGSRDVLSDLERAAQEAV